VTTSGKHTVAERRQKTAAARDATGRSSAGRRAVRARPAGGLVAVARGTAYN